MQFVGKRVEHGFARTALVGKHADLDQTMGVQTRVDFLFDGRRQAIRADHDHRVEMVCPRALLLALRWRKLYVGHVAIIG